MEEVGQANVDKLCLGLCWGVLACVAPLNYRAGGEAQVPHPLV